MPGWPPASASASAWPLSIAHIREAIELLATLADDLATAMRTAAAKVYLVLGGTLVRIERVVVDRPYCFRQTQASRGQPAGPRRPPGG
jgi:hypothetical protein